MHFVGYSQHFICIVSLMIHISPAAFISVVVLRHYQQQSVAEVGGEEEGEQQLALVVAEGKKDHAVTNYK